MSFGKSGLKFIVDHPIKGRILCIALGSVDTAKRMIGKPVNGGTCIGVVMNGRPVKDNEPPAYKANKPKATMRRDYLPGCVKRTQGLETVVEPPPLKPVQYEGHLHTGFAAVSHGVAKELPYEERMRNAGKFRPAAVLPQQSSDSEVNAAHIRWMHLLLTTPEAVHGLNYFTPCEVKKRWHGAVVNEYDIERMDRDQFPAKPLTHIRGRMHNIEPEWFNINSLDRDDLNRYVAPIPVKFHVVKHKETADEFMDRLFSKFKLNSLA
jgi:hypothetical protein